PCPTLEERESGKTCPRSVKIMLSDGRVYLGRPQRYSREEDAEYTIFLSPVAVLEQEMSTKDGVRPTAKRDAKDAQAVPYRCQVLDGVLLIKEAIRSVEFHKSPAEQSKVGEPQKDSCDLLLYRDGKTTWAGLNE